VGLLIAWLPVLLVCTPLHRNHTKTALVRAALRASFDNARRHRCSHNHCQFEALLSLPSPPPLTTFLAKSPPEPVASTVAPTMGASGREHP
jgi:hypothetical protein